MQSRHLIVKNGISKEAEGEITQHIVWKTWPPNSRSGLAIGGVDVDTTQTFFIDKKGPRRLENWSIGKVVYISKVKPQILASTLQIVRPIHKRFTGLTSVPQ